METPVTTGPSPVVPPPSAFPIFAANPSAQVGIGTGVPGSGTLHVVATPTTTHGAPLSATVGRLQVATSPMSMSQQQTQQPPVPASPGGMGHPNPQQSPTNFYGTLQSPTQPVTMQQVTLTPPSPGGWRRSGRTECGYGASGVAEPLGHGTGKVEHYSRTSPLRSLLWAVRPLSFYKRIIL